MVSVLILEAPGISSKSDEILQEGMVITDFEPGIYIPGKAYGAGRGDVFRSQW